MTIKLAVVMDPISAISVKKDTTLALLRSAMVRNWELYYIEQRDLYLDNGTAMAQATPLIVYDSDESWFCLKEPITTQLHHFDVVLMRKDPPFNMEYLYTTYILELAAQQGTLVINNPQSLREANEKLFSANFVTCCPPTLVTSNSVRLRTFLQMHQHIVIKPLDGMGGSEIFSLKIGDLNTSVILETMTRHNSRTVMAQRFIKEVTQGDKRILMINGQPIPHALARIPQSGEFRGNLAAGGTGQCVPLSDHDRTICAQVGPVLAEKGLLFVGLDVIGNYLTEINVTSPTCLVEIAKASQIDIAGQVLDCVEERLKS